MTNTSQTHRLSLKPDLWLGLFLLIVIGAGGAIGVITAPGEWYAGLAKPPFNPPNWIFAPVWFVLYIAIAIAGWRAWRINPKGIEVKLWLGQLLLNWLWSPIFFSAHLLWPAFVIISAIWLAIAAFIYFTWHGDRVASFLFMPYFAWVSFAALLNASVAFLN